MLSFRTLALQGGEHVRLQFQHEGSDMFDGFVEVPGETLDDGVRRLADFGDKPSLAALSYALRHRETWPKGFQWNYMFCRSCAMGLTVQLWPKIVSSFPFFNSESRDFGHWNDVVRPSFGVGMSDSVFRNIFFDVNSQVFGHDKKWIETAAFVRPEHVADAIDAYLATAA